MADSVSINPTVSYNDGAFTLSGSASSAAGVTAVEISAVLNGGARQTLGTATVNADGTFDFSDVIGANQQSFIEATLKNGSGASTTGVDAPFSLTGGLGPNGGAGRQTTYSADGSAVETTTRFRPNGQSTVKVGAPDQTVDLQPFDIVSNHHQAGTHFVFSPGDGLDVIHGFKTRGAGHDTLVLPSSDFTSLAQVFHNTGDVGGSAFITDPKTGDAVRLAGVSTAELKAHRNDISFA